MDSGEKINSQVIGSVRTTGHLKRLIDKLRKAGFLEQDLMVIPPGDDLRQDPAIALDHKPGNDPADEKPRAGSNKLKGIAIGALLGGLILGAVGGLIGLISFNIPRLNLMAASNLGAIVLIYAAIGAAAGVVAGGLIGLRAPEHLIKQHEIDKRAGRTLVSVHTQTPEASQKVMTILKTGGAEEVHQKVE